jgi:predicted nucleic acid-binding protein
MPKNKFLWESGIFITILTAERRSDEELSGLREVMDIVDRGQATIVVSSSASGEVLNKNGDSTVRDRFHRRYQNPAFFRADTNDAIWQRVAMIREAAERDDRKVKTPDAVHIATAIEYKVDAMHTFDDKLLRLSGKPYVEGLIICKPKAEQMMLDI